MMNIFRYIGDMSLLASILILLTKMEMSRSCRGISFETQALFVAGFITRYTDLFRVFHFVLWYNTVMKIVLIGTSCYILYLMTYKYRSTYDPANDTFSIGYLVASCLILGLIFNYATYATVFNYIRYGHFILDLEFLQQEMLWSFSIFLESVAILPQIFMLRRTGEAETITIPYLAALGSYRVFRILSYVYRYATEGMVNSISVIAGIVQTVLYFVFFYVYYTRVPPETSVTPETGVCSVIDSSQSGGKNCQSNQHEEGRSEESEQNEALV